MDTATHSIASKRALDILDQVKSVFALNGFDGTSMQDLAQATQMSVGNFYRYFPPRTPSSLRLSSAISRRSKRCSKRFRTPPIPVRCS